MPTDTSDRAAGLARASAKEHSNESQGRSGAGSNVKRQLAGATPGNKTDGGGINRATRGRGAQD